MSRRTSIAWVAVSALMLMAAATPTVAAEDLDTVANRYFPGGENAVAPRRVFRLTRDQLDAALKALLPAHATASVKTVMPRDPLQTNYEYADLLAFNAANAPAWTSFVADIAARVRAAPGTVLSCAATDTACIDLASRAFVRRAFRGDAPEDRIDAFAVFALERANTAGIATAAGDLVEVTLNSPHFLFRKEIDVSRRGRLTPVQTLAALSFTLADAPPEAVDLGGTTALRAVQTPESHRETVLRLLSLAPARDKLARFLKAWLEVKEPGEFTISAELFPEFTAVMAGDMVAATERLIRAETAREAPSLKNITQTTRAFPSKTVEAIYGVAAARADGGAPVPLDPATRLGIFSEPAVVASHSGPTTSRPIKRGVFWVRKVMCMEMEPPPKDLHIDVYELKGRTEREKIESVTRAAACQGCHKVIDPFAFFQESFDALGRVRGVENGVPVDTRMRADFLDEGPVETRTTVEALRVLTASAMFKQCFVRQMFRFYMGRSEEPADDAVLREMFLVFARDDRQDLLKPLEVLAASDRLTLRR